MISVDSIKKCLISVISMEVFIICVVSTIKMFIISVISMEMFQICLVLMKMF